MCESRISHCDVSQQTRRHQLDVMSSTTNTNTNTTVDNVNSVNSRYIVESVASTVTAD